MHFLFERLPPPFSFLALDPAPLPWLLGQAKSRGKEQPLTVTRQGQVQPNPDGRRTGHPLTVHSLLILNTRKNFFPLRVMEPWPRLPREAVESPSLEIFKTHLDTVLCSLLWVTLLRQGIGLGDPQRSLLTPTMLGFWDSGEPPRSTTLYPPLFPGYHMDPMSLCQLHPKALLVPA